MLKKIMFTLLSLIMIYSTAAVLYRIFEPESEINTDTRTVSLDYDSLNEYLLSTGEGTIHYLMFSSTLSADCQYVLNTVIPTVNTDLNIQAESLIEIVDVTVLDKEMNINRLTADWGLSSIPSFAAVHIQDGTVIMDNTLESDPQKPMSAADLEGWLRQNGLIK